MGCHSVGEKVVGPAFRQVAQKYSTADAATLAAKIRAGSQGAWGSVPMPPNPGVSEADAQTLASWVLQQK
jgi:cytochrome c